MAAGGSACCEVRPVEAGKAVTLGASTSHGGLGPAYRPPAGTWGFGGGASGAWGGFLGGTMGWGVV